MNYDYAASKAYCESIGPVWLGNDFLQDVDSEAFDLGFSLVQLDAALRHHLWQVSWLFNPKTYAWHQRIGLAIWFLFGYRRK